MYNATVYALLAKLSKFIEWNNYMKENTDLCQIPKGGDLQAGQQ